jgi:hypothetical protein
VGGNGDPRGGGGGGGRRRVEATPLEQEGRCSSIQVGSKI